MPKHRWLILLVFALGCEGGPYDPGFPPPGDPPPTPFPPGLAFRIGGPGPDVIRSLRVDPAGNLIVTGTFSGVAPMGPGGASPLTSLGGTDGFLAKYSPAGALQWAVRFGGFLDELVTDLAVDGAGNIYVAGSFQGAAAFDITGVAVVLQSEGGSDGFVARYTPDGALGWARRFGGTGLDEVSALAPGAGGGVYAVGAFTGQANSNPAPGPVLQSLGGRDGFLLALSSGGGVSWALPIGGPQDDAALGVAVLPGGDIAVAGVFRSTADFSRTEAATFLTSLGGGDVFLATYSAAGAFVRLRGFGGTGEESLAQGGLAASAAGELVLLGSFSGALDFNPGAGVAARQSIGQADLFLSRFDPVSSFISVLTLGGSGTLTAGRARVMNDGSIFVNGSFSGTIDFDPGTGVTALASLGLQGVSDAFVARYTAGGQLAWVSRFGEATSQAGRGVGATGLGFDLSGNPVVGGFFGGSPDFDPGGNSFRLISLGEADGFVIKLTAEGALAP